MSNPMQVRLLELAGRLETVAKSHAGLAHVRDTAVFRALQATEPKAWHVSASGTHHSPHSTSQAQPCSPATPFRQQHSMDWDAIVSIASGKGAIHTSSPSHAAKVPEFTSSAAQPEVQPSLLAHSHDAAAMQATSPEYESSLQGGGTALPPLARGPCGLLLPAFLGGYPQRPLLHAVCQALAAWALTAHFPFPEAEQVTPGLLMEADLYQQKKLWIQQQVAKLLRPNTHPTHPGSQNSPGDDDVDELMLASVLSDPHALLILLGFRITTGTTSQVAAIPGLQQCVDAFGELNAPLTKSQLTAGARALSKHCHRDSSAFWGNPTGPEAVKNQLAAQLLARLLQGAVWINLHYMPPDKHVLELRMEQGYGVRWEVTLQEATEGDQHADIAAQSLEQTDQAQEARSIQAGSPLAPHQTVPYSRSDDASPVPPNSQLQHQPVVDVALPVVKFRGFLEPQMLDGHQLGWQH